MLSDTANVRPFSSWEAIRSDLERLRPMRVLCLLAREVGTALRANDGQFIGDGRLNYKNLSILSHLCLSMCSEVETVERYLDEFSLREQARLDAILEMLNHRWSSAFSHLPRDEAHRVENAGLVSWAESSAIAGRNRSVKMEIARAWFFSEEDLPAELAERVDARRPTRPFDSVFEAVEARLAMAIAVHDGHGVVPSASYKFSQTQWRRSLPALLEACVPTIRSVVGSSRLIELYPLVWSDGLLDEHPIMRVGRDGLIAPDPSMVLTSFGRGTLNVIRPLLKEHGWRRREVGAIYGGTVERHTRRHLREIADLSEHSFAPELRQDGRPVAGSPDGFLQSPSGLTLVIEIKGRVFARNACGRLAIAGLKNDLWPIMGATSDSDRDPLEQGAQFFARWVNGDRAVTDALGPFPGWERVLYVLATPDDLPPVLRWADFRRLHIESDLRSTDAKRLWARTAFLSLRDLDVLLMTVSWFKKTGLPAFDAAGAVFDWHARVLDNPRQFTREGERFLLPSLGDALLDAVPGARSVFPSVYEDAFRAAMSAASGAAFGGVTPHQEDPTGPAGVPSTARDRGHLT